MLTLFCKNCFLCRFLIESFLVIFQGDSEFIGRALARPIVKMAHEKYEKPNFPPALEWFEICRGDEKAGELLAAFELLQVTHVSNDLMIIRKSTSTRAG